MTTTEYFYRKPGEDLITTTASLTQMQQQVLLLRPFPTTTLSEALLAVSPPTTAIIPTTTTSTTTNVVASASAAAATPPTAAGGCNKKKKKNSLERVDEMLDEILEMAESVLDDIGGHGEDDNDDDDDSSSNDRATDGLVGLGLHDVMASPPYSSSLSSSATAAMVTPPFPQARKRGSGTMMMMTTTTTMDNARMDDDDSFVNPFDDVVPPTYNNKNNLSNMSNKRARLGAPIGSLKTTYHNEVGSSSKKYEKIPFDVYSTHSARPPSMTPSSSHAEGATPNISSLLKDKWRFRSYQYDIWQERFQELVEYRKEYGHCLVPHNWSGNVPLAQWVKRQRYQYKLLQEGKHSTMSVERRNILNAMGFVWDSHKVAWEEKFVQLVQYASQFGHCNVSGRLPQHRPLSIWVKCQRRQRKLMERNEKSTMTLDRIERLDQLGFDWNPRNL